MSIDMWGGDAKREAAYWKGEYEEATIARRKLKQDYDAIVKDRDAWRASSKLREDQSHHWKNMLDNAQNEIASLKLMAKDEPKHVPIMPETNYINYVMDAHAERLDKIEAFLLKEYERIING